MSEEKEKQFQSGNTCWICEEIIENDNEKVRDPCHITGKFRGADHWSCNKNLQLTKTFPVIVHNLRGYGSHLIFCELKNSCFYSSVKDGTTDDNGKKLDGHISYENYFRETKFGTNLT